MVLCCAAVAVLAAWGLPKGTWLGVHPPTWPERLAATAETIDPNTASAASLRRLPGIGRVKAEAIVRFRAARAFGSAEDLTSVSGIGPATIRRIRPYLSFGPSAAR